MEWKPKKIRITLDIIPVGNVDGEILNHIKETLEGVYSGLGVHAEIAIGEARPVPEHAYDEVRKHYNAEDFLPIAAEGRGDTNLAVTEVGIFHRERDYVFGVGYVGGNASVMSTYRFKKRRHMRAGVKTLRERTGKEAIKQLGFLYGIEHCSDQECLFCYHPTVAALDRSVRLCEECKTQLESSYISKEGHFAALRWLRELLERNPRTKFNSSRGEVKLVIGDEGDSAFYLKPCGDAEYKPICIRVNVCGSFERCLGCDRNPNKMDDEYAEQLRWA